jgi:hypothetical protein
VYILFYIGISKFPCEQSIQCQVEVGIFLRAEARPPTLIILSFNGITVQLRATPFFNTLGCAINTSRTTWDPDNGAHVFTKFKEWAQHLLSAYSKLCAPRVVVLLCLSRFLPKQFGMTHKYLQFCVSICLSSIIVQFFVTWIFFLCQ